MTLKVLQNSHWQVGVVPQFGGGLVFGRIRYGGTWVDVLRPTPEDQYQQPGSFLMLPWANRIRDGVLRFRHQTWQLQTTPDDHTARHGDVRKRPWQIIDESESHIHMAFDSSRVDDFNFPFTLTAELVYRLAGDDFIWEVQLQNTDTQSFPAGFGFHPYFQHLGPTMPLLQVPCTQQFDLVNAFAESPPRPITEALDFRQPRAVTADMQLDHLLTGRITGEPNRLIYEQWQTEIQIDADAIFQHVLVFTAPDGTLAVEPQTNANDGFNLYASDIPGSGVFVLEPGEGVSGSVRLHIAPSRGS